MKKAAVIYSRRFIRIRNMAIGVAIAIVALEALFVNAPKFIPVITKNVAMATATTPDTFSELYFNDHVDLPNTIYDLDTYKFSFSIRNREFKKMTYKYAVYLQRSDEKIILDEGEKTLSNGQLISINETFGPVKNERMKVVVELLDRNQQISFWLNPEVSK